MPVVRCAVLLGMLTPFSHFGTDPCVLAMTRPQETVPRAAGPKRSEVEIPPRLKTFLEAMRGLSSKKTAPYAARVVPEDPKADLARLLPYVGGNGIEFVNLTNVGSTRAHPTTVRSISRDRLAKQVQVRHGEQLLWLMELAHFLRWWSDKPGSIQVPEPGVLVVTFPDEYVLTFRDQPEDFLLTRVEYLRDPDGGD